MNGNVNRLKSKIKWNESKFLNIIGRMIYKYWWLLKWEECRINLMEEIFPSLFTISSQDVIKYLPILLGSMVSCILDYFSLSSRLSIDLSQFVLHFVSITVRFLICILDIKEPLTRNNWSRMQMYWQLRVYALVLDYFRHPLHSSSHQLNFIPRELDVRLSCQILEDKPDLSRWSLKYQAFGQNIEYSWLARNMQVKCPFS